MTPDLTTTEGKVKTPHSPQNQVSHFLIRSGQLAAETSPEPWARTEECRCRFHERNSGWDVLCKLNIQATGMSHWSKFQPRFRASNSKWKTGCRTSTERKSRSAAPACERIHCSRWESHYDEHRSGVPVGAVGRLMSLTGPHRRARRVFQTTKTRRENTSCTSKKHVQHKQAHVMLVTQLWWAQL